MFHIAQHLIAILALSVALPFEVTTSCLPAKSTQPTSHDTLVVQNVLLIDGTGTAPREHMSVVVQGSRIVAVGGVDDIVVPEQATVIDGAGKFLIPGLWDSHVHLGKSRENSLPLFVANGVTAVRDLGGDYRSVISWRREIEAGDRLGPAIFTAGPILENQTNIERMQRQGMVEPVSRTRLGIATPEEATQAVEFIAALGVDFVKVRTVASPEVFQAIAAACDQHNLPLFGHSVGPPEDLLAFGQDCLEHSFLPPLTERGQEEREKLFKRMALADVIVTPTLAARRLYTDSQENIDRIVSDTSGEYDTRRKYLAGYLIEDWREQAAERKASQHVLERILNLLPEVDRDIREMKQAGVKMLAGSDTAVVLVFPGFGLHDELEQMVTQLQMTPMEALLSATKHAAECVGVQQTRGTLEVGKVADFVLLTANPLDDIRNTTAIDSVCLAGKWYPRRELDSMLQDVADRAAQERRQRNTAATNSHDGAGSGSLDLPNGVYSLETAAGDISIPAKLALQFHDDRYRGWLKVELPSPIYFALQSTPLSGEEIEFYTSSPAIRFTLAQADDQLRGDLQLTSDRRFQLTGAAVAVAELPDDFAQCYELSPFAANISPKAGVGQSFATLSPESDLLFYGSYSGDFGQQSIGLARNDGTEWRKLQTPAFLAHFNNRSPMLSLDGRQLFFASTRPLPGSEEPKDDYDLWVSSRQPDGSWGAPEPIDAANSPEDDYQPSVAADGTLYFCSQRPGGIGGQDLYRALLRADGTYAAPENLGTAVNAEADEMGCYISPDQSFLIIATSARRDGQAGNDDLYVSFATDGGWTEPRALGKTVNSFANEYAPFVDADGEYLYFASDRLPPARIYRVKTEDLEALTPAGGSNQ